eukprot:CAMPEP_0179372106 /NCGR_PEP_ID=MMETSP0797-20121207/86089_1 /TAXON_ID=47934 /ORGANISM="Dinophysis acuminata, Strain DAEP01" /LENGTH=200 /DNA_ID=CAMNT_0021088017 /DNA_START=98 /DNA_END=696 /DNA_ORIENTATION=-
MSLVAPGARCSRPSRVIAAGALASRLCRGHGVPDALDDPAAAGVDRVLPGLRGAAAARGGAGALAAPVRLHVGGAAICHRRPLGAHSKQAVLERAVNELAKQVSVHHCGQPQRLGPGVGGHGDALAVLQREAERERALQNPGRRRRLARGKLRRLRGQEGPLASLEQRLQPRLHPECLVVQAGEEVKVLHPQRHVSLFHP